MTEIPEELQLMASTLLDEILPKAEALKVKERLKIPVQMATTCPSLERAKNQDEVTLNLSSTQAQLEAMRCIQCKTKPCVKGCPVHIDIPKFIGEIAAGNFQNAVDVIRETSLLPAICGRVCPQESQCQENCTVGKSLKDVNKAVGVGRLERFAADWEAAEGSAGVPEVKAETGQKVAVVGSGPAGLVVAADLRREGHQVTVFEAFHKLGGVMRYGIPEFRLPNAVVDREIDTLRAMGVEFKTNFVVGRTRQLMDLIQKDGYEAVFIGTGAGLPLFTGIEGENLVGVFAANEYLTRANLMQAYNREKSKTPIYPSKNVAVLGGGNVAMDSARMALRLGAEKVHLIYRRSRDEMPARTEEVEHAMEEGVQFHFLNNAKRILGDEDGRVKAVETLCYQLGQADASGRRRPEVIEGSEFLMEVDTVLVAIGNASNPLLQQTTPELKTNKWGNITVDEGGKTFIERVYAGGDIVLGAATVILAMGEGRRAAKSINKMLAAKS